MLACVWHAQVTPNAVVTAGVISCAPMPIAGSPPAAPGDTTARTRARTHNHHHKHGHGARTAVSSALDDTANTARAATGAAGHVHHMHADA